MSGSGALGKTEALWWQVFGAHLVWEGGGLLSISSRQREAPLSPVGAHSVWTRADRCQPARCGCLSNELLWEDPLLQVL